MEILLKKLLKFLAILASNNIKKRFIFIQISWIKHGIDVIMRLSLLRLAKVGIYCCRRNTGEGEQ
jgi:hypothetical protein